MSTNTGLVTRVPSWRQRERAFLFSAPTNWDDACKEAGLDWEVTTEPVYSQLTVDYGAVDGWQAIVRNDKDLSDPDRLLAIQKNSYQVINNAEFGEVIDTVLGLNEDFMADENDSQGDDVVFEALMSLYGGRQIIALTRFVEPLKMAWDPEKTYRLLAISSRHDGLGGVRGVPTNVRNNCANTIKLAEMTDGKNTGFTIRHTANWEDRLADVGRGIALANKESAQWLKLAEELALAGFTPWDLDRFLTQYLPISDDMSKRKVHNTMGSRQAIRRILASPTCEGINQSCYGLLMACTEWSDHGRRMSTPDSMVSRQLLRKEEPKTRAASILLEMARV